MTFKKRYLQKIEIRFSIALQPSEKKINLTRKNQQETFQDAGNSLKHGDLAPASQALALRVETVLSLLAFAQITSGAFHIHSLAFSHVFSIICCGYFQHGVKLLLSPCLALQTNCLVQSQGVQWKTFPEAVTGRIIMQERAGEAGHEQNVVSKACVGPTSRKKMFLHSPLALLPWTRWLLGTRPIQHGSGPPKAHLLNQLQVTDSNELEGQIKPPSLQFGFYVEYRIDYNL